MSGRLRVAINAQVKSGSGTGGIESVLRFLTALSHLEEGDEEYVFIGDWEDPEWLRPLLGPRGTIVRGPRPSAPAKSKAVIPESLRRATGPLRPLAGSLKRALSRRLANTDRIEAHVPDSDGFYESLRCDVIHFPFQNFVRCDRPLVYNPHDLQHLHYPQFFPAAEIRRREIVYRAACNAAHTVVVASEFVKQDIVRSYRIPEQKIEVIPWAPLPLDQNSNLPQEMSRSLLEQYPLAGGTYALYPAMTWEHKNHIRLLEALALLRDRSGLVVNLICTGHQNAFWPSIERRLGQLALQEQVSFLGVVSHEELNTLYDAAQFVVVPTLFEAVSAPVFEAWQHDVAVACSDVTSLPEQTGGAALLFNPHSVEAIADALARMATDDELRSDLRRRGQRRLQDFSWERTVKAYRAVYRRAAGWASDDNESRAHG